MADMMQFDLVSPERKLASLEVKAVQIPGAEGDMTAMASHAPMITVLRPGIVTVEGEQDTVEYFVTGGFAEISPEGTSLLAERAIPRDEVTREMVEAAQAEAQAALDTASEDTKTSAAKRVNDFADLLARLF